MDNYLATFKLEVDEQYENEEQCGGEIIFTNLNNPDIIMASSQVSYDHFKRNEIENILNVLHQGIGKASVDSDFGNGGYFINLNDNIMEFCSCHFGTGNTFKVITNNSLITVFEKILQFKQN